MIKFYYSKAACSLSVHIVLEELGIPYEAHSVDIRQPATDEYLKINPMGAVPAIIMDNGQSLTEAAVIIQYLCDMKADKGLAPKQGTMERYRFQEILNFISTEIHKGFGPLWSLDAIVQDVTAQAEAKNYFTQELGKRFDVMEAKLSTQNFLMPTGYTAVDAYAYTILNWSNYLKVDLSKWPAIKTYMDRVRSRPATEKALRAEGLLK